MAENGDLAGAVTVTVTEKENQPEKASTMEKDKPTRAKVLRRLFTLLTFVLSLPVLGSIIWLFYMKDYDCERLLRLPKLQLGIGLVLIFIFLVSNVVVFFQSRFPMPGLLVVMAPLIVKLIMGLALVGAYDMESVTIPGSPMWLKFKVDNFDAWNNIKSCIYDTGACNDLVSRTVMLKSFDFSMKQLSSVEAGCCKPPSICEMQYVNATFWERGEYGAEDKSYPHDSDCDSWNNDPTLLCYGCDSCKEGFLTTLRDKWWKLGLFLVVMALLLIVSHLSLFLAIMWERYAK